MTLYYTISLAILCFVAFISLLFAIYLLDKEIKKNIDLEIQITASEECRNLFAMAIKELGYETEVNNKTTELFNQRYKAEVKND
jgi:uncharacterized membrane protein